MNQIKKILEEKGKSVGWLSINSGVNHSQLWKIIKEITPNPGIKTAIKIARTLHVKVEEIWKP
jgi:DNA-binding XRE family transcriptional regulator